MSILFAALYPEGLRRLGVFFIAFCYGYKWWTLRKFKK